MKFKVGDRVKYSGLAFDISEGTVTDTYPDYLISVKFDSDGKIHDCHKSNLELTITSINEQKLRKALGLE